MKYTYDMGAVYAETSVNFQYEIGFRNFDDPLTDKFFKLVGTRHTGEDGSFTLDWETENASGSFNISLTSNPDHWQSMFQDTALGKEANFKIIKSDLYALQVSEIKGLYSPQPTVM